MTSRNASTDRSNLRVALMCGTIFFSMVGLAFASVPLYRLFCQVTGYGGTTQRAEQQYSDTILDREVTVRFDANTSGGLGWNFRPEQRDITLKLGETVQVAYKATNNASYPTSGHATFNVTPELAGAYFNKVQCFCFTDTELKPGETLDMPVVFFVDPEIIDAPELKNIRTITLSYTFFPQDKPQANAAPKGEGKEESRKVEGNNG